jgi:Uncharacterized conserved protein (DUF2304)
MSLRAHILVIVVTAATLFFILRLVRRHRLRAKYSVLWVSLGAGLAVLATAPALLEWFSDLVGIRTPALGFLLLAITFLLGLSLHFSWELSRLEDRTRRLAEECALLSERQTSECGDEPPRSSARGAPGNHDETVGGEGPTQSTGRQFDPSQSRGAGSQRPRPS